MREFKSKLLDCELLILINDQHRNANPVEQVFLDINEKAQLLEVEDIFKGHCFENYDDTYHRDLRNIWVELKKWGMKFVEFGFESLSQYLYLYLLNIDSLDIPEKLTKAGKHYLDGKTMDETGAILNDMIVYGKAVAEAFSSINANDYDVLEKISHNIFSVAEALPRDRNSFFQHIDFSDYQLYTLTAEGAKSDYLQKLFSKVFAKDPENPFYAAYMQGSTCPHHVHCPVRHNFEFLMDEQVQAQLIQHIIEICIKDKLIVTSRDVLNFIFDAIASSDFDDKQFWKTINNQVKFIESYIAFTTPMRFFENNGISDLIYCLTFYSAKRKNVELRDNEVLGFYAADDITETVSNVLGDSQYGRMLMSYILLLRDNNQVVLYSKEKYCIIWMN